MAVILSFGNIADYLLDEGWVTADSLVDGDFCVEETRSRRHRSFMIRRGEYPAYFVKQVLSWGSEDLAAIEREATCYRLAREPRLNRFASLLPRFYGFDRKRYILLLEMIRDAESLAEHHRRLERFPAGIGGRLGELLGNFHRSTANLDPDLVERSAGDRKPPFPKAPPWILSIPETRAFLEKSRETGRSRVIDIVKRHPGFRETLGNLKARWPADRLMHGDLRWLNVLVHRSRHAEGREGTGEHRLTLIDWELADLGDPYWDVGGVLQSYLAAWIFSQPIPGSMSLEQRMLAAAHPLETLLPAVSAFWSNYAQILGLDRRRRREALEKSVSYAGARLIQTAFEAVSDAPAIPTSVLTLLQVGLNVLSDPRTAAVDLLELDA